MDFKTKFILGTAQFGSNYGIANFDGTVKKDDAINIIELMKKKNMKIIDTASSYHESEKRLGEIGVQGFDIISKLPFRNSNIHDLNANILLALAVQDCHKTHECFENYFHKHHQDLVIAYP